MLLKILGNPRDIEGLQQIKEAHGGLQKGNHT